MIVRIVISPLAGMMSLQAHAQPFPAKPVKLVVGYPLGGSGDFLTRLMADEMSKDLGVSVVADNRPGAGGNIANELVAKAPADGYTAQQVIGGNVIVEIEPVEESVLVARPGAYFIEEEEVPRAGRIVDRRFQRARWFDGTALLWIGRRSPSGRGEGSSGLVFDHIEEGP